MLWYDKGTSFAFRACSAEKNRRRGGREQEKAGTQMPAQVAMGCWLVLVPPYSCRAAGQHGMGELSGTGTDTALWCCFAAVVHGGAWGPRWWWVVQGRGRSWYFCFYWGRGRVVGVGKQIRQREENCLDCPLALQWGFTLLSQSFQLCVEMLWWSQSFGTKPAFSAPSLGFPIPPCSSSLPLGFKSQFNIKPPQSLQEVWPA